MFYLFIPTTLYFLNKIFIKKKKVYEGRFPPKAPTFVWSNVLAPRIWGFNLVGHWVLGLRILSALVCSIGLAVPINLDTILKLKDRTDTIMTRVASVIPYRSTLAWPGRTNLPRRWTRKCLILPWELMIPRISPEVRNQFQCHFHHTPLPTKHPFSSNNIGPLMPLATIVIITPN